jgi:DNA-binding XRE family transcriptional regulator
MMTETTDSSTERLVWEADTRRLRTARKRAGLTQAQLADRLEVQQQAVSHWETGKVSVP